MRSNILITHVETGAQVATHEMPWILSIAVYSKDSRYFGYILSHANQNSKTKMFCHVYRATRNYISTSVTDAIRATCHNSSFTSSNSSNNDPQKRLSVVSDVSSKEATYNASPIREPIY